MLRARWWSIAWKASVAWLAMQCAIALAAALAEEAISEEASKRISELERYEPFDPRRIKILEELAGSSRSDDERRMWYQQIADTLSAAAQSGDSPDGIARLKSLHASLQKEHADKGLLAYVRFRTITTEHLRQVQSPQADYTKLQAEFDRELERFVADHPDAPDAAEAMLQLAMARELDAQEEDARKWYGRVVDRFPDSRAAAKARGAAWRLDCTGKPIEFGGKCLAGQTLQLADYRGKIVLLHFWTTWSASSKADVETLKRMLEGNAARFVVLGVNLDGDPKSARRFLDEQKLPWPQIHEPGGMDSPPANRLGIVAVPTMILVDRQGKVANRAVRPSEAAAEVERLLR